MALNFNIEPFFDDYSEDKQFYRILFRPGYAVQARELTQLQTILQQQIKRQGDHLFKNGAMVIPGQISYDTKTAYVKLKVNISSSATIKTFSVLSSAVGKTYRGQTSGVEAIVLTATPLEVINGVTEADTLFVKYTRGTGKFTYGEIISPIDASSGLDLQVEELAIDVNALGFGTTATIEKGIYYIRDNFVLVQGQTTVLSKYSKIPSVKVGLVVAESIVYPEEDESLLDNALGSPNYAAPGAARYYIDLQLTSKPYNTITDGNEFITLLTIENGAVKFLLDRTEYAQLERTMARRTFDESGDYTVRDFGIELREYRNNARKTWTNNNTYIEGDIVVANSSHYKCVTNHTSASSGSFSVGINWIEDTSPAYNNGLYQGPTYSLAIDTDITPLTKLISLGIEPGKAYVRGYEIEKIAKQYLTIDKARDISDYAAKSINTSPGNYIIARSMNYLPDINTIVTFYDKYGSAGTVPAGTNAVIGTARIKQIQLNTLSPLTYKVFLFDVSVASGKNFARDAKYAFSSTGGSTATRFSAEILPTLVQLSGTLAASSASTTITGINTTFIQDLKQYDYVSITIAGTTSEYQVTAISSNNSITISSAISAPAGTNIYRVEATIVEPSSLVSYYSLPEYAINSTRNLHYSFYKSRETGSNVTTFTITETGYTFGTKTDTKNYIVVNKTTGAHLTYVSSGPTSTQYSITGDTTDTATFTFGTSGTYAVIYNLRKSSNTSISRQKVLTTLVVGETVTLDASGSATLGHADGFEILSIISGSTDVTSKFKFDTGARDSHYDLASINLLAGETVTGNVVVKYSYFVHTQGSGDYFTVDSYTHSQSSITYGEIPISRRNSIDFRPLKNSDGTFSSVLVPKYGEETDGEYNYYLGRIDKLSLSTTGEFIVTKGISDSNPIPPVSQENAMDLYTFDVEPYTFSGGATSVVPTKVENKRYTMRDIGRLENRINNLEYYATLSLLEQNTINNKAYDNYGLDRPQNGFIVDDFTGQGVGAASSADWNASIDMKAGELRPRINQTNVTLFENIGSNLSRIGRNYQVNGDIVTLKIASTIPLVEQARASHAESVNPFDVFVFNGDLNIVPWNDTWFEVNRKPDIVTTDTSQYDALFAKSKASGVLGTKYGSWAEVWQGNPIIKPGRNVDVFKWRNSELAESIDSQFGYKKGDQDDGEARRVLTTVIESKTGNKIYKDGINTFIRENITDRVINDKVISSEVIPYIRERKMLFAGDALKPNTRLYAFFDGVNIDSYISPAKIMTFIPYGTAIVPTFATDVNVGSNVNNANRKTSGQVTTAYTYGEVLNEYVSVSGGTPTLTGVSCIVLGQETYNSVNYAFIDNVIGAGGLHSDSGNNVYYLQGEFDSTRRVKLVSLATPTVVTSSYTGKIFGTFSIPNTADMSFRTGTRRLRFTDDSINAKGNSSTAAETSYVASGIIETRERTILSTKTGEIAIERVSDKTETLPTSITERVSSDTGWYDPLAQTFKVDIDGGAFVTDVTLYFYAKDDKVPVQVYLCNVVNGYPGPVIVPFSKVIKQPYSVYPSNNAEQGTNFKFKSPIYLQSGTEYALVVMSDSAKYKVWVAQIGEKDINGSGLISSQPYAGVLFKSQNASTWTADQTQDLKFTLKRAVFDTSPASLNLINSAQSSDTYYDLANISVDNISVPGTTIKAFLNNVNEISGNNIEYGIQDNIIFDQPQKLKDSVEENGTASLSTTITLSSTKSNISPVIDLTRCSATLVSNIIDSVVSDDEVIPELGIAKAKYVTKQIKLNQSSSHLRILFDCNVPSTSLINVYYKIGLQSGGFDDVEYTLMPNSAFIKDYTNTENPTQFSEVEARLELPDFNIVQIKIVMKSTNTSKVPRVKALRVIAYA